MKFSGMTKRNNARMALLAPLVVSGLAVSGCVSSPTYGTDKSATEQLAGDLTGMFSMKPKSNNIDYKPRPELVKPGTKAATLPAPQDNIVQTASADWPESPEARRARIRDDATKNRDNPNFEPQVVNDLGSATSGRDMSKLTPAQRKIEIERRLRESKQGNATTRKYLSEPPLAYREAASTAAQDELGEDEVKKERRLKKLSKKGGSSWWPF